MRNFNLILLSVLTLGLLTENVLANNDAFVTDEEAMETRALNLDFDAKKNTGSVAGKICDYCETMTVQITPQTKAYEQEKEVELVGVALRQGKPATVFFDKRTKEVTRIMW